jgi:flagellar biosynthetic protein FliR
VFWDLATWFVVFVRFSTYMLLFPLMAAQSVPVPVRLGFSAICAMLIVPGVEPVSFEGVSFYGLVKVFFREVATGLTLGMLARFIFYTVEMAGSIISTESGLMLSNNINPITSGFGSSPGVLLHWMTLILLFALDLHHWIIVGLQNSFAIVPAGGLVLGENVLLEMITRASRMFLTALQMTSPILACSFMVTLVFSLLGRAVPQMNVFGESFPVRTTAGLAVFGLTCSLMAQHIVNQLNRIPEDFIRVARMLAA